MPIYPQNVKIKSRSERPDQAAAWRPLCSGIDQKSAGQCVLIFVPDIPRSLPTRQSVSHRDHAQIKAGLDSGGIPLQLKRGTTLPLALKTPRSMDSSCTTKMGRLLNLSCHAENCAPGGHDKKFYADVDGKPDPSASARCTQIARFHSSPLNSNTDSFTPNPAGPAFTPSEKGAARIALVTPGLVPTYNK